MSVQAPPRPSRPAGSARPPRLLVVVVVVVLLAALVLVVVNLTTGGDDEGQGPVTIPLGDRKAAVVQIDSGADAIVVSTADLGTDLAVVATPDGEAGGVRPRAELAGDKLRVWTEETSGADDGGRAQIDVRIARGVRWDVVVEKGARQIQLALGSGTVNSIDLRGGADQTDVTLPAPDGELVTRIPTGMSGATFHVPAGFPAKAVFAGGAGRAVVDGAAREGIPTGTTIYGASGKKETLGEKGFAAAEDRILIDAKAGLGSLTLDRLTPAAKADPVKPSSTR